MAKTIIVSNRLPIKIQKVNNELVYQTSEGGLATGLGSIYKEGENVWIGWPGLYVENKSTKEQIVDELKGNNMRPVFLTEDEIKDYYEGFSNETLWPTFHYFNNYAIHEENLWEAYVNVNQKFCKEIIKVAEPGDTIWIHDYQLLILPQLVRFKLPQSSIGFFLHIPFPSYEVFRLLPWRKELLNGMLGADLLGFHTYDDMRHFLSSVSRLVSLSHTNGQVDVSNRKVLVDAFPMGIDYDKYHETAASAETLKREVRYRSSIGNSKLVLSIDRLDYSKGIPNRLKAFELFLRNNPEWRSKVSLLMVVVPSRDKVERYKELKEEIDELTGRINGQFGRLSWTPVHYFYRSFPLPALSAFYRMADVALVTPMRDGMNLVAKEYIASKLDKRGALVLSEMAGASKELLDSILINPNDLNQMVEALKTALNMPAEEQEHRIGNMQASLKKYNIHHWVKIFMERLHYIKEKQKRLSTQLLDDQIIDDISERYMNAGRRLIFADYDGTLSPHTDDPSTAGPDKELLQTLKILAKDPANRIVIISSRDKTTLQNWLGHLPIDLVAEHGVWLKEADGEFHTIDKIENRWKYEIRPILEDYVGRTPGSFLEEKDYSLVWHYRRVETGLGELRMRELTSHMKYLAPNMNLQVLDGDNIVEVKSLEVNKGKAASRWIEKFSNADFIVTFGDDWTDEDTFKAMPEHAITIKVGSAPSIAEYRIQTYKDVRKFLRTLANNGKLIKEK